MCHCPALKQAQVGAFIGTYTFEPINADLAKKSKFLGDTGIFVGLLAMREAGWSLTRPSGLARRSRFSPRSSRYCSSRMSPLTR